MLSVVFLARDERPRLPRALTSIAGVPEVVVCDTGSDDGTPDVAEALGARVHTVQWTDDFAAARTAAQAEARFDWIVRMDADEIAHVVRGTVAEWLGHAVSVAERREADVVYVRRRYAPGNEHWFPRIFRASRHRWRHPLHEVVVPVGERRRVIACDGAVFVHHPSPRVRGYAAVAARHLARNPRDPHLRYYRARAYWEEGLPCIAELEAYLAGPADYRFHPGEAHRMLGAELAGVGDHAGALAHLREAALGERRAEAAHAIIRLYLLRGERAQARHWIHRMAEARPPVERAPWGGWSTPYLLHTPAWSPAAWRGAWQSAA